MKAFNGSYQLDKSAENTTYRHISGNRAKIYRSPGGTPNWNLYYGGGYPKYIANPSAQPPKTGWGTRLDGVSPGPTLQYGEDPQVPVAVQARASTAADITLPEDILITGCGMKVFNGCYRLDKTAKNTTYKH